jgi:hypothetical protein
LVKANSLISSPPKDDLCNAKPHHKCLALPFFHWVIGVVSQQAPSLTQVMGVAISRPSVLHVPWFIVMVPVLSTQSTDTTPSAFNGRKLAYRVSFS